MDAELVLRREAESSSTVASRNGPPSARGGGTPCPTERHHASDARAGSVEAAPLRLGPRGRLPLRAEPQAVLRARTPRPEVDASRCTRLTGPAGVAKPRHIFGYSCGFAPWQGPPSTHRARSPILPRCPSVLSQKFAGILLGPRRPCRRCSSSPYLRVWLVVAPWQAHRGLSDNATNFWSRTRATRPSIRRVGPGHSRPGRQFVASSARMVPRRLTVPAPSSGATGGSGGGVSHASLGVRSRMPSRL